MKKKKLSRNLACVRNMPELLHSRKGEKFDLTKSMVILWLIGQPHIQQYVFDKVNEAGLIVYDADTCTWKGVDHED